MGKRQPRRIGRFRLRSDAPTENPSTTSRRIPAHRNRGRFRSCVSVSSPALVHHRQPSMLPEEPGAARAWLFCIANNVLLNHRRSERRRSRLADRVRVLVTTAAAPSAADPLARASFGLTARRPSEQIAAWPGAARNLVALKRSRAFYCSTCTSTQGGLVLPDDRGDRGWLAMAHFPACTSG